MSIELNECRIARRGKGAKGSVEAFTIGIPVNDDNGIAKAFEYNHVEDISTDILLEKAKELGNVNQIIARGIDLVLKSSAIKAQATSSMLQARIMREGLAKDKKEAKSVAAAIVSTRSSMVKMGMEPLSIDTMLESRRQMLEKQKAK